MSRQANKQMCCVSVGYRDVLLPLDDGLKLMKLLSQAAFGRKAYQSGGSYGFEVEEESLPLDLTMIQADKIHMPESASMQPAKRPRALTNQQLALPKLKK